MREFMARFIAEAISKDTGESFEEIYQYNLKRDFFDLQRTYDQWRVWSERCTCT